MTCCTIFFLILPDCGRCEIMEFWNREIIKGNIVMWTKTKSHDLLHNFFLLILPDCGRCQIMEFWNREVLPLLLKFLHLMYLYSVSFTYRFFIFGCPYLFCSLWSYWKPEIYKFTLCIWQVSVIHYKLVIVNKFNAVCSKC